jgi:hypothetical protein
MNYNVNEFAAYDEYYLLICSNYKQIVIVTSNFYDIQNKLIFSFFVTHHERYIEKVRVYYS